ncbi:MAG: aspartate dehydrogenase [Paucimonas sp.]|nr:aspartate dehydrogenase [Paucimonas sp.]
MRIGIIGFGAIGQTLYRLIGEHVPAVVVAGVMDRADRLQELRSQLPGMLVVSDVDSLLAQKPALVIECAGHAVLQQTGPAVLEAGADLLVASVGALADPVLEKLLADAAASGGARVHIPAGALGGLDVLGAARFAGLDSVTYISNKAPRAWKGTPAEGMVDLDNLTEATVFFTGDARTAALMFPQNANVAAATALAGLGFERTRVMLTADPAATGNRHRIQARGAFGEIDVTILGKTLPENPKTSMLAPYSLVRSLVNLTGAIAVA